VVYEQMSDKQKTNLQIIVAPQIVQHCER